MSRVLLTGASGFVGGHLARRLTERGEQVRCLVRSTSDTTHLRPLGVEFAHGDLSQSTDWNTVLADVDLVYHVAGKTAALRTDELHQVNGTGTYQLARACAKQTSPPTFVFMSSLAAAGPTRASRPLLESDPSNPISYYGRSKRAGELAAEAWADEMPVTILRPGIVFGPRNREMLPIFRSVIRFRVHALPGFQVSRVSLIHIDDLIEITVRAAGSGSRVRHRRQADELDGSGYYFACAPQRPTYAGLGRMIARAAGHPSVLLMHLVDPLPWLAAAVSQLAARLRGQPDSFNLDKIREAKAGSWLGSADKVRRELEFTPPLSLDQRIGQTVDWYVQSGWL